MVAHPIFNLGFLTMLLASYFLVSGVFEVIYSFQVRPNPGWLLVLVGGGLSILLGWLIFSQWPLSGAWAVGVLVGIKVIFLGVTLLSLAGAARSLADRAQA